jgi:hypothetical protein
MAPEIRQDRNQILPTSADFGRQDRKPANGTTVRESEAAINAINATAIDAINAINAIREAAINAIDAIRGAAINAINATAISEAAINAISEAAINAININAGSPRSAF